MEDLVGPGRDGAIRYSTHVVGQGEEFFRQACRLSLEGVVSKRRDRPYEPGRGRSWLKVKCIQEQEFVVGGFTEPKGTRTGLGALLLGVNGEEAGSRTSGRSAPGSRGPSPGTSASASIGYGSRGRRSRAGRLAARRPDG